MKGAIANIMDLQEKPLIGSLSSKTKRVLVLDWLPQYNQLQLHKLNLMMRGITKIKDNVNYGEMLFEKN